MLSRRLLSLSQDFKSYVKNSDANPLKQFVRGQNANCYFSFFFPPQFHGGIIWWRRKHHIMAIYKWIILNTENINKRHWDSCEQFGNSKIQFLQWINFLIAVGWMQFYLQWVIDCKMHLGTRVHIYIVWYYTTIAIDWILEENFNEIHCVPHFNHTICNKLFTHAEQRRGFNAPTSVIMSHSEAESE